MEERVTTKDALAQIGVTKNTLYRWEKGSKVPYAKRDRNGARIYTTDWIRVCIDFRDRVVDPNEGTANENTAS